MKKTSVESTHYCNTCPKYLLRNGKIEDEFSNKMKKQIYVLKYKSIIGKKEINKIRKIEQYIILSSDSDDHMAP